MKKIYKINFRFLKIIIRFNRHKITVKLSYNFEILILFLIVVKLIYNIALV